MKVPKRKPEEESPAGEGGGALERLRFFQEQRGIVPPAADKPAAPQKKPRRKPR